jgi:hypothetical protein
VCAGRRHSGTEPNCAACRSSDPIASPSAPFIPRFTRLFYPSRDDCGGFTFTVGEVHVQVRVKTVTEILNQPSFVSEKYEKQKYEKQ